MNIKKFTKKDRHGNMMSFEFDTPEVSADVPPMNMIPQYNAVGGMAANHPGEPKGSDTVPAWLTPGEFVVNKEAVDIYGPQIKKMNDVGREIQDGDMSPTQAPPIYANAGIDVNDLPMWKQQLMEREGGYRSDIYDPFPNDGKWEPTTGYGHLLDASKYPESMKGKPGPFKTEAAAREQFEKDVGTALIDAQSNIGMEAWQKLQPQQQWGLTNMAFQLGRTGQAKFDNMIKAIQAEDYDAAKMHAAFNRNKNTKKYDIKTDWHTQTPTRVEDFNYFMSRWDPVNIDVPVSKPIEGSQPAWITRAQQLWQDMDKPKVEIPEANPSSGGFLSRWFPGHSGKKKSGFDVKNIFKMGTDAQKYKEGGPIYASQGFGIGFPSAGFDGFPTVEQILGYLPEIPFLNQAAPPSEKVIDNTIGANTNNNQAFVPGYKRAIAKAGQFNQADVNTIEDMEDVAEDKLKTKYSRSAKPEDWFKEDHIKRENLPPLGAPPTPNEMGYGNLERKRWSEFNPYTDIPGGGNVKELEDEYKMAVAMVASSNSNDPAFEAKKKWLNKVTAQLEQARSNQNTIREWETFKAGNEKTDKFEKESKKSLNEIEKRQQSIEELKKRIAESTNPDLTKKLNEQLIREETKLSEIQHRNLSQHSNPENYKKSTVEKLKEKYLPKDKTEGWVGDEYLSTESEDYTKAKEIIKNTAQKLNTNTEAAITNDLNTDKGKQALENSGNNKKEVSFVESMFKGLFGDLIDKKELQRAVAIYLGSRLLGYEHGDSISYVAKQYMDRVDANDAAMDKWIQDNLGKFEPGSMEEYRRTKDPSKLIPIGAAPRSTGKSEMRYNKNTGSKGMAYEFKIKNAQGEDRTYWSFDITGKDKNLSLDNPAIGYNWTDKNVLDVDIQVIDNVTEQIQGLQNIHDKHSTGSGNNKRTKFHSSGRDVPSIIPAAAAAEVSQWLHDRGIPPGKSYGFIDEAYRLLVQSNRKLIADGQSDKIHNSLIPFLQEATIKARLEDFTYIDKSGKIKPIPSPAFGIVDGERKKTNINKLMELENKINMLFPPKTVDRFWSQAAQLWEQADEETKQEFKTSPALKEGWTPFALWANALIEETIEEGAKTLPPQ